MAQCNTSTNIFVLGLASSMVSDIRSSPADKQQTMEFAYVFSITSLVFISLISNILSILTFIRPKFRRTTVGIYILFYSIYSLIGMLMLQFRLIQFIDWLSYVPFFFICNVVSGLTTVLTRQCLWMGGFIAFHRSLEARYEGHRVFSTCRSAICQIVVLTLVVVSTHIPEFYSRVSLPDPIAPDKWICEITYTPALNVLNTVFACHHILIPFLLNLLSTIFLIRSVIMRKFNLQSSTSRLTYWYTCKKQLKRHRDLFVAPSLSIICMLPQLAILLKYSCIDLTLKWLLRLNISANVIIYLVPTLTFFIYVYPSTLYYAEFQLQITRIKRYFGIKNNIRSSGRIEAKRCDALKRKEESQPASKKAVLPTISGNKKNTLETMFTVL